MLAPRVLDPKALPEVLGEVLTPGMRVVTLINRSGLQLGSTGDAKAAAVISAITSNLWQCHEKCEGAGALECLLIECDEGRLAVKPVGTFILTCCADTRATSSALKVAVRQGRLPPA